MNVVMIKNPGLSESYYISSFLRGLQEIKATVKMHRSKTLQSAFEVARWQEMAPTTLTKKNKSLMKSTSTLFMGNFKTGEGAGGNDHGFKNVASTSVDNAVKIYIF
ncbi:hypothetical protein ACH5RR_026126 [Cinchona calisaya]|uniref:Uncharacterized protein n=1 Tax=Cinchona calisaya TaxID=153742 RepID=A0ABD2Z2R4_9GENT